MFVGPPPPEGSKVYPCTEGIGQASACHIVPVTLLPPVCTVLVSASPHIVDLSAAFAAATTATTTDSAAVSASSCVVLYDHDNIHYSPRNNGADVAPTL